MSVSWKTHVAKLCSDTWALGPYSTRKVIEAIEVLITTDQLSDFALEGVLASVGIRDAHATEAAPSIHLAITEGAPAP